MSDEPIYEPTEALSITMFDEVVLVVRDTDCYLWLALRNFLDAGWVAFLFI